MPDQRTLSPEEVTRLLGLQEGHFLDLKRAEIAPGKLSQSISAFANTGGGELFVGIGENVDKATRFWNGFPTMEAANGLFQVLEGMTPLGNHYDATFLSSLGQPGHILHLVVQKTRTVVRASDGHPYVRRNAQNLRVAGEDAARCLQLDKGIITFEDDVVNTPLDTICNSEVILSFILEVVPNAEPVEWLRKQQLILDDRPVVAGALLFSDEPQATLPKRSAIKIYRYQRRAEEGTREQLAFDPITIEGCLYDQISEAVSRTKQIVEGIKTLTSKGLEAVIYPHETLHEIITNAVLHRDYSIPTDVHVRIYDNRIEIESPGRLPGHVTPANKHFAGAIGSESQDRPPN